MRRLRQLPSLSLFSSDICHTKLGSENQKWFLVSGIFHKKIGIREPKIIYKLYQTTDNKRHDFGSFCEGLKLFRKHTSKMDIDLCPAFTWENCELDWKNTQKTWTALTKIILATLENFYFSQMCRVDKNFNCGDDFRKNIISLAFLALKLVQDKVNYFLFVPMDINLKNNVLVSNADILPSSLVAESSNPFLRGNSISADSLKIKLIL